MWCRFGRRIVHGKRVQLVATRGQLTYGLNAQVNSVIRACRVPARVDVGERSSRSRPSPSPPAPRESPRAAPPLIAIRIVPRAQAVRPLCRACCAPKCHRAHPGGGTRQRRLKRSRRPCRGGNECVPHNPRVALRFTRGYRPLPSSGQKRRAVAFGARGDGARKVASVCIFTRSRSR